MKYRDGCASPIVAHVDLRSMILRCPFFQSVKEPMLLHPHRAIWTQVGGLVSDGIAFSIAEVKTKLGSAGGNARAGYEPVGDQVGKKTAAALDQASGDSTSQDQTKSEQDEDSDGADDELVE